MNPYQDVPPDRMWWCKTCNGGVGVWGVDRDSPPPRCPDCKTNNFIHVKYVPECSEQSEQPGV